MEGISCRVDLHVCPRFRLRYHSHLFLRDPNQNTQLLMSFFISLTVTILLLATYPISGGHINPVVTFSAALIGLISFARATIYITAQCAGAVLGALAVKAIVSSSIVQAFSLGGCTRSQSYRHPGDGSN